MKNFFQSLFYIVLTLVVLMIAFPKFYQNVKGLFDGKEEQVQAEDISSDDDDLITNISTILHSKSKNELWDKYSGVLKNAGSEVAGEIVGLIAPMSGRNAYYKMSAKDIEFDSENHKLSIYLNVSFEAKDLWSGISYGECQISGNLDVYLNSTDSYARKAYFYWKKRNNHIVRVSKSKHWRKLDNGLYISL